MGRDRFFICPQCGEPVSESARSCPHCGSDEETGWNPYAEEDSIELPDDEPEDAPGTPRPGATNAFIVLLLCIALLGVIALYGFAALGASGVLFGALIVVAVVVHCMRRRR